MPGTPLLIPETKPAMEFIDGQLVQKMSPFGLHARVQRIVASALGDWADELGRGRVGTEWDFDLTPPGERKNRLVPDVAFLSYDRLSYDDEAAAQVPKIGPDVAVEILSQGQTLENSHRRLQILFACGTRLVVVIDPRAELAWLVDANGTRLLGRNDAIEHPSMPGFVLPLRRCFERVPPGGRR
ncbi:MAG TPA: Uma2 family endonuclease [Candidatus Acidoferrales bacterium]|jgi:Uma2 family endonuclease|nr:Uma2 family endonuclease [Candidatus Acidoferrales bacterium]